MYMQINESTTQRQSSITRIRNTSLCNGKREHMQIIFLKQCKVCQVSFSNKVKKKQALFQMFSLQV